MNSDDFTGTCELAMTPFATSPALDEQLLVGRADPRVKIVGDLVREAQTRPSRFNGSPYLEQDGDLLRINGDNRKVVYRLVAYLKDEDMYLAEWPD